MNFIRGWAQMGADGERVDSRDGNWDSLTGLDVLSMATRASARFARCSPGCNMAGFQPYFRVRFTQMAADWEGQDSIGELEIFRDVDGEGRVGARSLS